MDGMLLVTFFFPLLVSFNLALSIVTFSLSLFVSFGPEVVQALRDLMRSNEYTKDFADLAVQLLVAVVGSEDKARPLSVFWSLLVSGVAVWTTLSTYGVGGAMRHGKTGWRFIQPGVGGIRFVFVQIFTWITFALAVAMPWTTLKDVGWLTVLGVVADKEKDPASHRGLLVVGSAFGMLSNTFVILGLMSFDPQEKGLGGSLKRNRRTLDLGKWRWNLFGDSEAWWWLFLMLQGTLVVFSWQLAVMMEMTSAMKNQIVESLLLMVVTALLAIPVALTNIIAGKWRHGERNYRLSMPCQGGAIFVALQGLGWALYGSAVTVTLLKLYSTATASNSKVSISSTAYMGFASYLCIVASLFVFDPSKVKPRDIDVESEDESSEPDTTKVESKHVHSVLGKRQSPKAKGKLEYLVQWTAASKAAWVLEELLLREDPDALRNNERAVRTPRLQSTQGTRGRSMSPGPRKQDVKIDDVEEDDDEEEEDVDQDEDIEDSADEDDEVNGSDVSNTTDSDSEDIWEEMEDEHGNVFYFNEKKNVTSTSIPHRLAEALAAS